MKRYQAISYIALAIAVVGVALALLSILHVIGGNSSSQAFGNTIKGIDQQLTSQQLAVINSAPNSYFETAGEMLLNGTLSDPVFINSNSSLVYAPLVINGKPSVVYVGAITCIYCGENRWAMALALSRFGSFSSLYQGYSAIGDGDVPTLYWTRVNYTKNSGVAFGNAYQSSYINFISADYESSISAGFVPPPSIYYLEASAPNASYSTALAFMNSTNGFEGTPFAFWGTTLDKGADGVVFGNSTPTSAGLTPLAQMTHQQVLSQLKSFNDQFAYGEYAAADVYVAQVCAAINNSASACALPAITKIESLSG